MDVVVLRTRNLLYNTTISGVNTRAANFVKSYLHRKPFKEIKFIFQNNEIRIL